MTKIPTFDLVGEIMAFEGGDDDFDMERLLRLFSHLVNTGMAWTLQGFYGRTAMTLIENGYIDKTGKVLNYEVL